MEIELEKVGLKSVVQFNKIENKKSTENQIFSFLFLLETLVLIVLAGMDSKEMF